MRNEEAGVRELNSETLFNEFLTPHSSLSVV